MLNLSKYENFIDKLIVESPNYMVVLNKNERYLLFDRFVSSLSENAMPWLFKVYLEQKYNILKEDQLTEYIRNKYRGLELNILNINGNLFFNKNLMCTILNELELQNQIIFNQKTSEIKLV